MMVNVVNQSEATLNIARYLRTHHEHLAGGMWEQYLKEQLPSDWLFSPPETISIAGVFLGTQVAAGVLAVVRFRQTPPDDWTTVWILVVADLFAGIFTAMMLKRLHELER